jgi:hypothetical protein
MDIIVLPGYKSKKQEIEQQQKQHIQNYVQTLWKCLSNKNTCLNEQSYFCKH